MNRDVKYLGVPNVCFSLTEKKDKREKEFAKQRIERGFENEVDERFDSTYVTLKLCLKPPTSYTGEGWIEIKTKQK